MLTKLINFLEYTAYFLFLESSFYQQSFAIFLQFRNISFINKWNISSCIMALVSLIPYVGYPLACYIILRRSSRIYYTRHAVLMQKFGILVDELDVRRRLSRMFILFILLRRTIHVAILVFAHDSFFTEISLLILMNIGFIICLVVIRPYVAPSRLKKEIFGEVLLLFIHICICIMKIVEANTNLKYQIGWLIAAGCSGIIGIYLWEGIQMCFDKAKALLLKLRKSKNFSIFRSLKIQPTKKKIPMNRMSSLPRVRSRRQQAYKLK